jgi:hypothetical protein
MRGRFAGWRVATTVEEMARRFDVEQRKVTEILGIEAGYRYVDSPVIAPESGVAPGAADTRYTPTTWPGARLPHVWLDDGSAIHDRLGDGYTLLRLGPSPPDTSSFEGALRATGAPLDVQTLADAAARAIYERDLVLVRPDLHVVWRGDRSPDDPAAIAARATGRLREPSRRTTLVT